MSPPVFTNSKDGPAIGVGDPLIWSLLVCALAVAVGTFFLMRDQSIEPIGGFGGADSDRGFPLQAGSFELRGVRELAGGPGGERYLSATYQQGLAAPVTIQFHPIPAGMKPSKWLDEAVAAAKSRGDSVESYGRVEVPATPETKATREGGFVNLKGRLAGDPVTLVWTQRIRDGDYGFAINAPDFATANALRSKFRRTSVPVTTTPTPTPDPDGLPVY